MNFKNLKIVKKLATLSPRLKWLMFSKMQDLKIGSDYIDFLIPEEGKNVGQDDLKLEQMVRETLAKEFGADVKNLKSYELLVDATVHNLKKKQLAALGGEQDFEDI